MKKVMCIILAIICSPIYILFATAYGNGDVNKDGEITKEDAELALEIACEIKEGTKEEIKNADIDGDGIVSSADAKEILEIAKSKEPNVLNKLVSLIQKLFKRISDAIKGAIK